jgi:hypothetical protein
MRIFWIWDAVMDGLHVNWQIGIIAARIWAWISACLCSEMPNLSRVAFLPLFGRAI